jgi:hypothetical protein
MNAVSTFRPHKGESEYARNQIRAVRSWQNIFGKVLLIGEHEPDLAMQNVEFVKGDDFPYIKDMIFLLSQQPGWSCWINCDIVLNSGVLSAVRRMEQLQKAAATSQRWTFNPETADLSKAVVEPNDFGLDIFITSQAWWNIMHSVIPSMLRKGGQVYDTWMTGYFWNTMGHGYCSLTGYRCVFHPRHEGRRMAAANAVEWIQDEYGRSACIPPPLR